MTIVHKPVRDGYKCQKCGGTNREPECMVCEMRRKGGRCPACDRKAKDVDGAMVCPACGDAWGEKE